MIELTTRETTHEQLNLTNFVEYFDIHYVRNDDIRDVFYNDWVWYHIGKYNLESVQQFFMDTYEMDVTNLSDEELIDLTNEFNMEIEDFYQYKNYYIISSNDANIIKKYLHDDVLYNPTLDLYLWAIDSVIGSWDYLLTDFPIPIGLKERSEKRR